MTTFSEGVSAAFQSALFSPHVVPATVFSLFKAAQFISHRTGRRKQAKASPQRAEVEPQVSGGVLSHGHCAADPHPGGQQLQSPRGW